MPVGKGGPASFTARGTPIKPRHLCAGVRLVHEYKPFRIKVKLPIEPCGSLSGPAQSWRQTTLLAPHSQARVAAPQRVPSFFERDLSAIEKTPKRADADRNSKLL
jgi:hypothetical protein